MKPNEFTVLSREKTVQYLVSFRMIGQRSLKALNFHIASKVVCNVKMKKLCSDCVDKRKMNCFNCEMERACKTCLGLISDKKVYSAENIDLKKNRQMLPRYEVEHIPRQNSIDYKSAKEISMEVDRRIIETRRFEMINTMLKSKSCMRNEEIPENIVMFV